MTSNLMSKAWEHIIDFLKSEYKESIFSKVKLNSILVRKLKKEHKGTLNTNIRMLADNIGEEHTGRYVICNIPVVQLNK